MANNGKKMIDIKDMHPMQINSLKQQLDNVNIQT